MHKKVEMILLEYIYNHWSVQKLTIYFYDKLKLLNAWNFLVVDEIKLLFIGCLIELLLTYKAPTLQKYFVGAEFPFAIWKPSI